jgi:hypothetical protein
VTFLGSDNLDLATLFEDLQADPVMSPLKKEIYTRISHSQVPDPELRNLLREIRPIQPNLSLLRVQGKSETRLQQ